METEVSEAGNAYSAEGDSLLLDPDLYDADTYDIPDPGLLKEKNELFTEPIPRLFTGSSWWQNQTARARARQLWLLLRGGLHDFVEKEKRSELCVARLTHGLEPLRHLKVAAGLCSVAQDPVGRRFVVLDGAGNLHVHREDGWADKKLRAPAMLTGLVAMQGPLGTMSRFVGWGPEGLAILRPDLSLLWLSEPGVGRVPGHEPICCLPVPSLGLLLVAEAGGSLVLWEFRSGGRRLVPRGSPLQLPPSPAGTLTRLVLGPPHSHQVPCCFAAYGSAVLTFDLHTWALVDVRQDLHKTTIWDVAYCLEVGALVTASQDSTVKVWEADWQIRMVFMGHTGPVTALAVLPNTSRVLSASRDGTLRTWDLQTAAQVGEVALSCPGRGAACGLVTRLLAPAGPGWPVLSLSTSGVDLWRLRELYSPLAQLSAPVLHLQLVPALPASAHPLLPARLVCACADGSVYLVAAATGRTVSALLLEPDDRAASVLYCLPREALWLLTRAGHLVCADAARCPMRVLRRVCPPAAPARRPCCLHLYSHLTDPGGARASWQAVCRRAGEPGRRDAPPAWKDKNRYLPVLGHTDGTLSVLEWRRSKTVFQTEAHSPGPVTAIASTWNSVVSSGGDLTVKMWRVYPYAEESLSLLRTFSCCHPAVGLCALGRRITVAFENPDSATYGLVQFGLGDSPRSDHRPQDDPTDHITGLCCCPSLRLYACSSLDCSVRIWTAENRLLRLLQLNGPPQGLTFSSDSGDLVLALGSWLCLVSHRLYLPTLYLVKSLCQKVPDVVPDPPLPLTSQESLTPAQLQRLANLQGTPGLSIPPIDLVKIPSVAPVPILVCSPDSASIHRQTATPPRPVLEEDLEALAARDRGLQQLRLGLVVPTAPPPPSWQHRQEAFDNYLHLIYGRGLLDVPSGREFQQWSTTTLTMERETWDVCTVHRVASGLWQPRVCTEGLTAPAALARQEPGAMGRRFVHPPRVPLPIPATRRGVHSRASQLLARSSLSSNLGLSLDLQLQWERFRGKKPVVPDSLSLHLQHRVPLLKKRRPHEPLSNLRGCFPATIRPYKPSTHLLASPVWALLFFSGDRLPEARRFPEKAPGQTGASASRVCPHTSSPDLRRPIGFPGSVPNSVVLRQLWLRQEVSSPGAFAQLTGHCRPKPGRHQDDLWQLWRIRRPGAKGQQDLTQWLGEEEQEGRSVDWFSDSLSPHGELSESEKTEAQSSEYFTPKRTHSHSRTPAGSETGLRQPLQSYGHALWEERSGYLPRLLHFFVGQNWFKELFPVFTLEAYPEVGTAEGLASMLMDALCEASWTDRVHVLRALLRLLPDLSRDLRNRLQGLLVGLLNLDQPPSLEDQTQKEFVMLALQLLLACSLESREVVLELLSYFLYSPASCRPELRKLLDGLGLQDPPGFLFKEMMTWVQGPDADSKVALRKRCCHKLEEMIQRLQMQHLQPSVANLSEMLLKVSQTVVFLPPPKEALPRISVLAGSPPVSGTAPVRSWVSSLVVSPQELNLAVLQSRAKLMPSPRHLGRTKRGLSEALSHFWPPEICACSSAPDVLPEELPPLEQTDWSRSQMLDLETIDALNFFCKQLQPRAQLQGLPQEQLERPRPSPCPPEFNTVLPQPRERWHYPILRLQEAKVQKPPMKLRGWKRSRLWVSHTVSGSIRMLKLPLPRAEVRPFPPDWPRPARPLPPLLLQPTLQRYFLPEDTDPDSYS